MWFKYVISLMAAVVYSLAYQGGAPQESCQDQTVGHGRFHAQKTPSPYVINTSAKVVKAGTPMKVTISGNYSVTLHGLLLQARQGDKIVGSFLPPNDDFSSLLNCSSPNNAITQWGNYHYKPGPLVYTWTPPKGFNGEIKFRAVILEEYDIFWVGVESPPLKVIL